jgi:hypothetical protein
MIPIQVEISSQGGFSRFSVEDSLRFVAGQKKTDCFSGKWTANLWMECERSVRGNLKILQDASGALT